MHTCFFYYLRQICTPAFLLFTGEICTPAFFTIYVRYAHLPFYNLTVRYAHLPFYYLQVRYSHLPFLLLCQISTPVSLLFNSQICTPAFFYYLSYTPLTVKPLCLLSTPQTSLNYSLGLLSARQMNSINYTLQSGIAGCQTNALTKHPLNPLYFYTAFQDCLVSSH